MGCRWASDMNPCLDVLRSNIENIRHIMVGLDGYFTTPDFNEEMFMIQGVH